MTELTIPAISREIEFIACHIDEADDIHAENVKLDPTLKHIFDSVYSRANQDVKQLLVFLTDAVGEGASKLLRINSTWHRPHESWELWSDIYSGLKGPKKKVGWVSLYVACNPTTLLGSMSPSHGGLDGRKKFAVACKKKMPEIHLTREHPTEYPAWEDCIIWLKIRLELQTSREDLRAEVEKQAKRFFTICKPLLKGA